MKHFKTQQHKNAHRIVKHNCTAVFWANKVEKPES